MRVNANATVVLPHNERIELTEQSVIKFACVNLPPLCPAAHPRCYVASALAA